MMEKICVTIASESDKTESTDIDYFLLCIFNEVPIFVFSVFIFYSTSIVVSVLMSPFNILYYSCPFSWPLYIPIIL
jgi:hypothetical protein